MTSPFAGYYIAISIVSIMIAISGIAIGLGYSLNDKKLKEFGQTELYQSIINGVIVGALFFSFSSVGVVTGTINSIVQSTGAATNCAQYMSSNYAICFAYNYLVGIGTLTINGTQTASLLESAIGLLAPVSLTYVLLALIGSLKFSIVIVGISLASVVNPVLQQLSYLMSALTFAIMGIEVQAVLLNVVSMVAVPVLLPIGIVLRTFYFTRKLGGTIIAIAIGLFTVFPMSYLLDAQITSSYSSSINSGLSSALAADLQSTNSNLVSSATSYESANTVGTGVLNGISNTLKNVMGEAEAWVEHAINIISILIVEVFFLPTFSIILTIISIRELAKALGSEISFGKFDIF